MTHDMTTLAKPQNPKDSSTYSPNRMTTPGEPPDIQKKRKRKRPFGETIREAYREWTYHAVETTQFFPQAYQAKGISSPTLLVHRHVNGLCIVTAPDLPSDIIKLHWKTNAAPPISTAEQRKKLSKLLQGKRGVEHTVTPNTVLVEMERSNGTRLSVPIGVWGTVVEIHEGLTPRLLLEDPTLDGYLAIVQPAGDFPPPSVSEEEKKGGKAPKV